MRDLPSNDERRIEILRHILDRQKAKQRTTKAEVMRHMRGVAAINTTHRLIMDLIKEGKLNVEVINSQVHFLTVSENFDFSKMLVEVLKSHVEEAIKQFENVFTTDKVNIKITKRSFPEGYDTSIHVYPRAIRKEIDEAIKTALYKKHGYEQKEPIFKTQGNLMIRKVAQSWIKLYTDKRKMKLASKELAKDGTAGHTHQLQGQVQVYEFENRKFFKVNEGKALLIHEEYEPLEFEKGLYEVIVQASYPYQDFIRKEKRTKSKPKKNHKA